MTDEQCLGYRNIILFSFINNAEIQYPQPLPIVAFLSSRAFMVWDGKISVQNNVRQGNENNNYKNSSVSGAEVWTPRVARNMIEKVWLHHHKRLFDKLKVKNTLQRRYKGQQTGFTVNEICRDEYMGTEGTAFSHTELSLDRDLCW